MEDEIMQAAEEMLEELPDDDEFPDDVSVTAEAASEKIQTGVRDLSLPMHEAVRVTKSNYVDKHGGDSGTESPSTAQDAIIDMGDLSAVHDGNHMTIEGSVTRLFELSDAQASWMSQSGKIGDDTGATTFSITSEAVEENPSLELQEGQSYRLEGVVGDEYEGDVGLIADTDTSVTEIDASFDPPAESLNSGGTVAESEDIQLGELVADHDEEWLCIRGKVQRELELDNENVSSWVNQRVIMGDNTGTAIFTIPDNSVEANSDLELEVGKSYELDVIVGDEYGGRVSIQATPTTTVESIDETFEVPENDTTLMAPLIDIQNGSGLIKRCPLEEDGGGDCNRMLDGEGRCSEHGDVDGEFDLRLKTVFDDGDKAHQVQFGRDTTEALTGISMEEARTIAQEKLEMGAVEAEIKDGKEGESGIMGHYYQVKGDLVGEYVVVDSPESVERVNVPDWQKEVEKFKESIEPLNSTTGTPAGGEGE